MERIQKLKLDFTETGSREEFLSAYCGDMNSNVVELEVTPSLKGDELLICSFLKGDEVIETLVVENHRLVIPYSVLREAGDYTASFAVADVASRLTATATLSVTVASDSILIAPTEDMSEDQSLVSYIISSSAIAARAAAEEEVKELSEEVASLTGTVNSLSSSANKKHTALEEDISELSGSLSSLSSSVSSGGAAMQSDIDKLTSAVSALTGTVSSLSSSATEKHTALEEDISELSGSLSSLSSSVSSGGAAMRSDIDELTATVASLSTSLDETDANIAFVDSDLSVVASDVELIRDDVTALAEQVEQLKNTPSAVSLPVASGTAALASSTGSYVCVSPECNWLRVQNTVFVQLSFYSTGNTAFTVTGLPFANSRGPVAVPVVHGAYSSEQTTLSGDFLIDRIELPSGSSSFNVVRQSSSDTTVSAVLVYQTSDPMPQ